jgi:major vault protein
VFKEKEKMTEPRSTNELVLSPSEYAYTQDLTSGVIKVSTGPNVVNATNQEYPVSYNPQTKKFQKTSLLEAAQQFITAQQGEYVILNNPALDKKQPDVKSKQAAAMLETGQQIVVKGPSTFALWPGQYATVIQGHNLRSNQYLLIRVRDEDAAKNNWSSAVIKAAGITSTPVTTATDTTPDTQQQAKSTMIGAPSDIAMGKHYIIRGDEFSFYIPPTGVEVIPDENGAYVRNAVTLERLEYCILIDENGTKRYERGPKVVFPSPSEQFLEQKDKDNRSIVNFKPIELNEIQGLHVKVISDYDENGKSYKNGEELFIRGTDTPIYFPRPEHALVSYDGKHKHFATAVPAGEARYLLDRKTGYIKTVKGPTMLLPDPRSEVIVRRVLTDRQCKLWYPGNVDVAKYNVELRQLRSGVSSTRGAISDGEVTRSKKLTGSVKSQVTLSSATIGAVFGDKSTTHSDTLALGADELERSATYNEPRTLTLDTKLAGVPTIEIWTGYAVLVVDKAGKRRVEVGPKTIHMEYDEQLESLKLSTGKPKTTDQLFETSYLRVENNQIGDVFTVETSDHVTASFKVSLRGNFTGESDKWFKVENYVKLVCDHVRSLVKSKCRMMTIEELYRNPADIVRDIVLGVKDGARKGLLFEENGFSVFDVDVLEFTIGDQKIAQILSNAQHVVVESNITLELNKKKFMLDQQNEEIARLKKEMDAKNLKRAQELQTDIEKQRLENQRLISLTAYENKLVDVKNNHNIMLEQQAIADEEIKHVLERKAASSELDSHIAKVALDREIMMLKEQTAATAARLAAVDEGFTQALIALNNQETLVKVANAMSVQTLIGGDNVVDAIQKAFKGSPLETAAKDLIQKTIPALNKDKETNKL